MRAQKTQPQALLNFKKARRSAPKAWPSQSNSKIPITAEKVASHCQETGLLLTTSDNVITMLSCLLYSQGHQPSLITAAGSEDRGPTFSACLISAARFDCHGNSNLQPRQDFISTLFVSFVDHLLRRLRGCMSVCGIWLCLTVQSAIISTVVCISFLLLLSWLLYFILELPSLRVARRIGRWVIHREDDAHVDDQRSRDRAALSTNTSPHLSPM
jgi:hypothetical protein